MYLFKGIPRQTGPDCGVFCSANADCVSKGIPLPWNFDRIDIMRLRAQFALEFLQLKLAEPSIGCLPDTPPIQIGAGWLPKNLGIKLAYLLGLSETWVIRLDSTFTQQPPKEEVIILNYFINSTYNFRNNSAPMKLIFISTSFMSKSLYWSMQSCHTFH
jgi:hypothetical protein